jgi:outer membrane protein/adhesin transport system outer membrane protein
MTKEFPLKMIRAFVKISPALVATLVVLLASRLSAQQVDFHKAIELALQHSGNMKIAAADRSRAADRYHAERDTYYPTVVFGVSPGYSYGVAVTVAGQAPSLYNITHTQPIFNLSLADAVRAAHSDSIAADIDYTDRADQVILDTALLYSELDSTNQRLDAARTQKQSMDRSLFIAQQRQSAGLGSLLDSKRAELDAARVDLRIADLEASVAVLRERLARTIGVNPATLETVSGSIPAAPSVGSKDDFSSVALANSNSVRTADEHLRAAHLRARAEHRVNYPSVDFSGQYAELTPYINYGLTSTTPHNYSFAFSIRVPLFNLSQNARAAAADAEALHAEADAQNVRDQVAADAVRAQHAVRQLEAAAKVSRLEYELAEANIGEVQLQLQNGRANAHDQELARANLAGQQVSLLQTQFDFFRAQLQLLRQIGELRTWALGQKK